LTGNLIHIFKRVAKPEAEKALANEVQNNMQAFNLLYIGI